jgi:RNA polymerase sigma factor (sigma-70 family)
MVSSECSLSHVYHSLQQLRRSPSCHLILDWTEHLHCQDVMAEPESTCWSVIESAAAGTDASRNDFARRYLRLVRESLAARWRASPCIQDLDDAVQEVFVECFKKGGILDRVERERPGGFRAFLYGTIRNVALRFETARSRAREHQGDCGIDLNQIESLEESLSWNFDQAWARALLREAAVIMGERAKNLGEAAVRRVELLRLRFREGLPIREIARLWESDPAVLHHEYARARHEFRARLLEVVAFHHPGSGHEVEQTCAELLSLLS